AERRAKQPPGGRRRRGYELHDDAVPLRKDRVEMGADAHAPDHALHEPCGTVRDPRGHVERVRPHTEVVTEDATEEPLDAVELLRDRQSRDRPRLDDAQFAGREGPLDVLRGTEVSRDLGAEP